MRRLALVGVLMVGAALSLTRSSLAQSTSRTAAQMVAEAPVLGAEEQFRRAKVDNDTATLRYLLSEAFLETNQNGNSRNKAEMIALFESFQISSLTTDRADVRFSAEGIAVVHGAQTERRGPAADVMLFTRVWVREAGAWKLLSSAQFLDPQRQSLSSMFRTGFARPAAR